MFIYKYWFLKIFFYICQNIHFADILKKYKIFFVKKYKFFVYYLFFKSRFCSYINLDFLQFHWISAKIYSLQIKKIFIYIKSFTLKNCNKECCICRLCLLINFSSFIYIFYSALMDDSSLLKVNIPFEIMSNTWKYIFLLKLCSMYTFWKYIYIYTFLVKVCILYEIIYSWNYVYPLIFKCILSLNTFLNVIHFETYNF